MRIARIGQPDSIVDTLGERPPPGKAAQKWDLAAGHLHQHQAAYGTTDGLGPVPQ